jgi:hypothetical protein
MGLTLLPLLIFPIYLAILAGIFYLIYTWVNKFIVLINSVYLLISKP